MGVIWFVFHVHQLILIRFTQQKLWCINGSTMKDLQKLNLQNQTSLDLVMVIIDAYFLIS